MFVPNPNPEERPVTLFTGHTTDLDPAEHFRDRLERFTPIVFAAPTFAALNVIVYLFMCFSGVSFFEPTTQSLLHWGANYGPLTATAG